MNIQEAKEEIGNTLRSYLEKDVDGEYCYPLVRQRPILLMGPPGIGKTAIMEQISREYQVGLVSYTITHHTRQSAVGLPRIKERHYEDQNFPVTEYTMSEIIDSVYECMQRTGRKEGILFIDEINCASETLAPTMLQFLQNKTFGTHKVPDGWMIVAAGNPPRYNKSVHEFDIVTLDRVRRIDINIDVDTWLLYARNVFVHGAIVSYLEMRKDNFYVIENKNEEKHFVTARGWEDLSEMLKSYERLHISVTEKQVLQFIQNEEIADNFFAYYQIYCKYGEDYAIPEMLHGRLTKEQLYSKIELAKKGNFEERFTVTEFILSALSIEANKYHVDKMRFDMLYTELRRFKQGGRSEMGDFVRSYRHSYEIERESGILTKAKLSCKKWVLKKLEKADTQIKEAHAYEWENVFETILRLFDEDKKNLEKEIRECNQKITNAFAFLENCFGDGQEMLLFVTGLSKNETIMEFISDHGCDAFFQYSDRLLYKKRSNLLLRECEKILNEV